jgi:hypothetical protein
VATAFGGTGYDFPYGVATRTDGTSLVTGRFQNTVAFGGTTLTSAGSYDIFVLCLNPDHSVLWAKSFGGTGKDYGRDVATRADGTVVVVGYFEDTVTFGGMTFTSAADYDTVVLGLSTDGNVIWATVFSGSDTIEGRGVAMRADNTAVVTGHFGRFASTTGGTASFGGTVFTSAGYHDIFVICLSTGGSMMWAKQFGGLSDDKGFGIATRADGTIVVTGSFQHGITFGGTTLAPVGSADCYVVSLDTDGNVVWAKSLGGSGFDYGYGIATRNDGTAVVMGAYNFDIYVFSVNADGSVAWSKQFSASEGRGATVLADGTAVVAGYFQGTVNFGGTTLSSTAGERSSVFIRLNADGSTAWAKAFGGSGSDEGCVVATHTDGTVVAVGAFRNTVRFRCNNPSLTSAGGSDTFVLSFV